MAAKVLPFIQLTKPSIILLVLVTSVAALAAQGFLFSNPLESFFIIGAIALAAGSANAFNQYFDRDIDQLMDRTKSRRPLPQGLLKPSSALTFAILLGAGSTAYLWMYWTPLSAIISAGTIFYYAFFYTLVLKRRHHYNIVIGGAAGATGPLIAWAAIENNLSLYSWLMFILIFMWTPPHFWALALAIKDEYKNVKVPMLPVTHGIKRTKVEIWLYTFSLLPISLVPWVMKDAGFFYLLAALVLWLWYLLESYRSLAKKSDRSNYLRLFGVSIFYLFFLFVAMMVDGALRFYS